MNTKALKTVSYIYLILVPIIGSGLGFGIGHVSYKVYLPIWILNVIIMTLASWFIGLNVIRSKNQEQSDIAKAAFFFIVPMILISMFAGLGPPPETALEWISTATEQQLRYFMLVIAGVFIALGFVFLKDRLKSNGENFYSLLSMTAILIAIPLFIINMLFWGFYLTDLFKLQTTTNAANFPDWFLPTRQLFGMISITEVALTYFATFSIAIAMRKAGWISKSSSFIYILISLLALSIIILSVFFKELLKVPSYALSIPAFPFLMPYFIGVNLLRTLSDSKISQVNI